MTRGNYRLREGVFGKDGVRLYWVERLDDGVWRSVTAPNTFDYANVAFNEKY